MVYPIIGTKEPTLKVIKSGEYFGNYFDEKGFNVVSGIAKGYKILLMDIFVNYESFKKGRHIYNLLNISNIYQKIYSPFLSISC